MRFRSSRRLAVVGLLLAAAPAIALDYRSVDVPAAIVYDAPSQKGKKLYLLRRHTPVELVVNLESWAKVREPEGSIVWIEKKVLSDKRTAIVVAARAEVRQAPESSAALVFEADKGVALELVESGKDGWARVRHPDGQGGYVRALQVWGL